MFSIVIDEDTIAVLFSGIGDHMMVAEGMLGLEVCCCEKFQCSSDILSVCFVTIEVQTQQPNGTEADVCYVGVVLKVDDDSVVTAVAQLLSFHEACRYHARAVLPVYSKLILLQHVHLTGWVALTCRSYLVGNVWTKYVFPHGYLQPTWVVR